MIPVFTRNMFSSGKAQCGSVCVNVVKRVCTKAEPKRKYDVVIVGGGLCFLACEIFYLI